MHPYYFRILLTLIALVLVGLVSFMASMEAFQLQSIIIPLIVAAVMIVWNLPITRRQLMKTYVLINSYILIKRDQSWLPPRGSKIIKTFATPFRSYS